MFLFLVSLDHVGLLLGLYVLLFIFTLLNDSSGDELSPLGILLPLFGEFLLAHPFAFILELLDLVLLLLLLGLFLFSDLALFSLLGLSLDPLFLLDPLLLLVSLGLCFRHQPLLLPGELCHSISFLAFLATSSSRFRWLSDWSLTFGRSFGGCLGLRLLLSLFLQFLLLTGRELLHVDCAISSALQISLYFRVHFGFICSVL